MAFDHRLIKHFRDLEASGFNRALQLPRFKIEGFLNQVLLWPWSSEIDEAVTYLGSDHRRSATFLRGEFLVVHEPFEFAKLLSRVERGEEILIIANATSVEISKERLGIDCARFPGPIIPVLV